MDQLKKERERGLKSGEAANYLSGADKTTNKRLIRFLEQAQKAALASQSQEEAFALIKAKFDREVLEMKASVNKTKEETEQLFAFVESAFGQGNEMLILVTELTANQSGARFIALFGCDAYRRNCDLLMLSERQNRMQEKIRELQL